MKIYDLSLYNKEAYASLFVHFISLEIIIQ